jgi:hypothetical protein
MNQVIVHLSDKPDGQSAASTIYKCSVCATLQEVCGLDKVISTNGDKMMAVGINYLDDITKRGSTTNCKRMSTLIEAIIQNGTEVNCESMSEFSGSLLVGQGNEYFRGNAEDEE